MNIATKEKDHGELAERFIAAGLNPAEPRKGFPEFESQAHRHIATRKEKWCLCESLKCQAQRLTWCDHEQSDSWQIAVHKPPLIVVSVKSVV